MRLIVKTLTAALMAALILLFGAALADEYAQQVLIYMVGSDLSGENAVNDLNEIMAALVGVSGEDMNVLVLTGGAERWGDEYLENGAVYRLTDAGAEKLVTLREAFRMDQTDALAAFLSFAAEEYPARQRGLILWDHGFGPMEGFGLSADGEGGKLTLSEITAALKTQDRRFDWIGFDACLMGSVETASALAPYADYLIASEETEPGDGWNYAFLGKLSADMSAQAVGTEIVNAYEEYYWQQYKDYPYLMPIISMNCFDLQSMGDVEAAMDVLFTAMSTDIQGVLYGTIVNARNAACSIGSFTTGSSYDLVDLKSFAENLSEFYPQETLKLMEALENCKVAGMSNDARLSGLSVYFPFDNIPRFLGRWGFIGENIGCSAGYRSFLHNYSQIWMAHKLEEWQPAEYTSENGEYFMVLTDEQLENLASCRYIVLEEDALVSDSYRAVYYGHDLTVQDNRLIAGFDGNTMFAVQGDEIQAVLAEKKDEDSAYIYFHLWVTLNSELSLGAEGQALQGAIIQVKYDKAQRECLYYGAIPDNDGELLTGKTGIRLEDWASIVTASGRSFLPSMDGDGNYLPYDEWNYTDSIWTTQLPVHSSGRFVQFEFSRFDTDNEGKKYVLLIEATDVYGKCIVSKLIPLTEEPEKLIESTVRYSGQPVTLIEDGNAYIRLDGISWEEIFDMNLTVRNDGRKTASSSLEEIALNGNMIPDKTLDVSFIGMLETGQEKAVRSVNPAYNKDLRSVGIDVPVRRIDLLFSWDNYSYVRYYLVHIDCLIEPVEEQAVLLPRLSAYEIPETLLYEDGTIKVELLNVNDLEHLTMKCRFTNLTDSTLEFDLGKNAFRADGWLLAVKPSLRKAVLLPGLTLTEDIEIEYEEIWRTGASPDSEITCLLELFDYFTSEKVGRTGAFPITFVQRETKDIFDSDGVRLGVLIQNANATASASQEIVLTLVAENSTLSSIELKFSDLKVNGIRRYAFSDIKLSAGSKRAVEESVNILQMLKDKEQPLKTITVTVTVWNVDTMVRLAAYENVVLYSEE